MRTYKELKKVLRSVIALSLAFFLFCGSVVEAYTTTVSGVTAIAPTNKNFKSAKSPMYINKTQSISGKISSSFKMNMYHYECQEGGYYQVYTNGNLDSVGAIFEEENSLLRGVSYKQRAFNDSGQITPDVDNCSMVIKMDKNEDYYVCIRGFADKKGSYTLKIEPNQDKTWKCNYGVWKADYAPTSAIMAGVWTSRKMYITKEQAILYYWTLDPATTIQYGKVNYTIKQLQKIYAGNPSKAISIATTALSSVVGVKSNALGITMSIIGLFLSETFTSGKSAKEEMREKLVEICKVKQNANAKTWKGKWSSKNGMLVKETYTGTLGKTHIYTYSKFNGTMLTGEKWYCGKWTY